MMRWLSERAAYLAVWAGVGTGCVAAKVLPRRWLYGIADGLATVGFYLFQDFRRRSLNNVRVALKPEPDGANRIVQRSLKNFFRDFVEIFVALVVPAAQLRSEVALIGRENIDAALAAGNGVIVLSAHLGNFFLLGTRLALEGYPVHVLINQPATGPFGTLLDDYRLRLQQRTIHARPRRRALRELAEVLRRNEIAVVIADEHRRGTGIEVPFFGHAVLARRGPATLALRSGAAVVPAYLLREGDYGLRMIVEPALELARDEKSKAHIRENTLRMTRWLEKTVRAHPDQWNWMIVHWRNGAGGSTAGEIAVNSRRERGLG